MTTRDIERFWSHVEKSPSCWIWTGSRGYAANGRYGRFEVKHRGQAAHRVAYGLQNGPIPPGMLVCHHCDNTLCVRGDHLFLGTALENMRDKMAKGRWTGGRPIGTKNRQTRRVYQPIKLSAEDVIAIRGMFERGECSKAHLARQFGVSHHTIREILQRTIWKHV